MISQTVIFHWLLTYKYFILFPVVVFEGPLATMASGFLVSMHVMNAWLALPIIVTADVTGDVLYYCAGRFGFQIPPVAWFLRKIKFDRNKERIAAEFQRRGGKLLLFGKLTHALGAVFLVGAGYGKMPFWKFVWYNAIGTAVKSSALLFFGYIVGSAYERYSSYFEYGSLVITIGSILVIAAFYYFFSKKMEKMSGEDLLE